MRNGAGESDNRDAQDLFCLANGLCKRPPDCPDRLMTGDDVAQQKCETLGLENCATTNMLDYHWSNQVD